MEPESVVVNLDVVSRMEAFVFSLVVVIVNLSTGLHSWLVSDSEQFLVVDKAGKAISISEVSGDLVESLRKVESWVVATVRLSENGGTKLNISASPGDWDFIVGAAPEDKIVVVHDNGDGIPAELVLTCQTADGKTLSNRR